MIPMISSAVVISTSILPPPGCCCLRLRAEGSPGLPGLPRSCYGCSSSVAASGRKFAVLQRTSEHVRGFPRRTGVAERDSASPQTHIHTFRLHNGCLISVGCLKGEMIVGLRNEITVKKKKKSVTIEHNVGYCINMKAILQVFHLYFE